MDRSHPRVKISRLLHITHTKNHWSNKNVVIDHGKKWYCYLKNKSKALYDLVVNVFLAYFLSLNKGIS